MTTLQPRSRRVRLLGLVLAGMVLAACGGGGNGDEDPSPTGTVPVGPGGVVPTATAFAQEPQPTIVTGDGTGSPGGGSTSDEVYTVEPGDSLSVIAAQFGVSVDAIREANDLTSDNINVGDELVIPRSGSAPPGGTSTPGPGATATPPPEDDDDDSNGGGGGGDGVHVVESGDTPLGIAIQYGISLEELEEANGGPLGVLQIGQEIIIP